MHGLITHARIPALLERSLYAPHNSRVAPGSYRSKPYTTGFQTLTIDMVMGANAIHQFTCTSFNPTRDRMTSQADTPYKGLRYPLNHERKGLVSPTQNKDSLVPFRTQDTILQKDVINKDLQRSSIKGRLLDQPHFNTRRSVEVVSPALSQLGLDNR